LFFLNTCKYICNKKHYHTSIVNTEVLIIFLLFLSLVGAHLSKFANITSWQCANAKVTVNVIQPKNTTKLLRRSVVATRKWNATKHQQKQLKTTTLTTLCLTTWHWMMTAICNSRHYAIAQLKHEPQHMPRNTISWLTEPSKSPSNFLFWTGMTLRLEQTSDYINFYLLHSFISPVCAVIL